MALLAAGQNSTLTGTMAGQIVMEGFLHLRLRPWVRRMLTRLVAIVPAAVVASLWHGEGVGQLLVLSQVILSLQLSFAVVPLVCSPVTGENGPICQCRRLTALAWVVSLVIIGLNAVLDYGAWRQAERANLYHHILVPLDNSAVDEAILQHIRQLAGLTNARLTLVHVADGFVARNQQRLRLDESEEMRLDRAYLDRRTAELTAAGFQVDAVLECGEPADKILEMAESRQCDLIAMSTHGHGFFSDLVLGSVADKVRHRTDVPVLLIRSPRA